MKKFFVLMMLFALSGLAYGAGVDELIFTLLNKRNELATAESQLANVEKNEDAINDRYDKQTAQLEKQKEQLEKQIEQIDDKIKQLEDKRLAEITADEEKVKKAEGKVTAAEQAVDDVEAQIIDASDIRPENIHAWHPNATCQLIAWEVSDDVKTGLNVLVLTVLNNRKNNRLTTITVTETVGGSGESYYRIDNAPQGLQVFVPEKWTIDTDKRPGNKRVGKNGFFSAKIVSPENITKSQLDGNSNINGNVKTFADGEAFIVLRQSPITIHLPKE